MLNFQLESWWVFIFLLYFDVWPSIYKIFDIIPLMYCVFDRGMQADTVYNYFFWNFIWMTYFFVK